jgi:hypothetical protein
VGQPSQVAPQVALAHARDHLGGKADHLGLEQGRGLVAVARPDQAHQPVGDVRGRTGPRPFGDERRLVGGTRATYGLLATSVGLTALWNVLEASRAGTASGPDPLNTYSGLRSIVAGGVWDLILAAVLGMMISSGEFRHHTATSTYLVAPGRNQVLAAKAITGAAGGAVLGLAGYAVACTVGLSFSAAKGYPVPIGPATFVDWGAGHLLGGALLGVIGVAVGVARDRMACPNADQAGHAGQPGGGPARPHWSGRSGRSGRSSSWARSWTSWGRCS